MPIVLAPTNQQLRIVRIAADDKLKKHLESLGITLDGEITVLSSSGGSVVGKGRTHRPRRQPFDENFRRVRFVINQF